MEAEVLSQLIETNLAAAVAIGLVLAARKPVRTWLGARAAYALWTVVPAAMLASFVPARIETHLIPAPVASAATDIVFIRLPGAAPAGASGWHLPSLALILTGLWLVGLAIFVVIIAVGQMRAVARFGRLSPDAADPSLTRAARSGAGPALVGIVRPKLVLPADFEDRFEASEQAMILAHERTHLVRGDAFINAVVALLRAINWFNPLVHAGAKRLRVDQELACDAAVVGRFPGERRIYAQALLKTQLDPALIPLGCAWPGGSSNLLRERLEMLAKQSPTRLRLSAGAAAVAALSLGAGVTAWAMQAPQTRTVTAASPAASADPLSRLAADVSGVFDQGSDPRILLIEEDHGAVASRTLRVGEEYRDGWKLSAIAANSVSLKKGNQTRTVALEGRKAAPATEAPQGAPGAKVATTNAGGVSAAGPLDATRVQIASAIGAGDVRQVMTLGGSASDVAKAFAARGGPMAEMLASGGDAKFITVNGKTGLSVASAEGGNARGIIMPPELSAFPTPPDATPVDLPGISVATGPNGGLSFSSDGVRTDPSGVTTLSGSGPIRLTIPPAPPAP